MVERSVKDFLEGSIGDLKGEVSQVYVNKRSSDFAKDKDGKKVTAEVDVLDLYIKDENGDEIKYNKWSSKVNESLVDKYKIGMKVHVHNALTKMNKNPDYPNTLSLNKDDDKKLRGWIEILGGKNTSNNGSISKELGKELYEMMLAYFTEVGMDKGTEIAEKYPNANKFVGTLGDD